MAREPSREGRPPLLSVRDVTVRFGGIVALDSVSFDVPERSVLGLIGPNGAGKTTLFNVMTRIYRAGSGDILYDGRSLFRLRPDRVIHAGIARTFQNLQLWPRMTVRENVMLGYHCRLAGNPLYFVAAGLGLPGVRSREREAVGAADEALEYVGLHGIGDRLATGLPFGTLKAIELARALVSRPRLLLLDEPAGGLNHPRLLGHRDRDHRPAGQRQLRPLPAAGHDHPHQRRQPVADHAAGADALPGRPLGQRLHGDQLALTRPPDSMLSHVQPSSEACESLLSASTSGAGRGRAGRGS